MSGGKICIKAPKPEREKDIIVGNVCFMVLPPERRILMVVLANDFCIRNSGVNVVVEGIGDHGLEYMTGGHVLILGDVGKNFGQGMSGGVCYVFPSDVEAFKATHALETLAFKQVVHQEEQALIRQMLEAHIAYTNSTKARDVLKQFDQIESRAVKVIPKIMN